MSNRQAILCIDDEVIVLDSLKEQLENIIDDDIYLETIENGEEALEVLDELLEDDIEIPLVIADYIMPQMTGDKVLTEIFKRSPHTRNILLTGQANLKGVENAVNNANLYRFISKPWDKNDLALTVKEALLSYRQEKIIFTQNEELKELNAELEKKVEERTKQLQELNVTKDKFFSIIAHDLKNPFNSLIGFTELILQNYEQYSKEKIYSFVQMLNETSQGTYALLQNLLEWSRSQTGRIKFEPENVEVNAIVDELINIFSAQAKEKEIDLLITLDDNLVVFADENMIKTVLRNLISNALKYTRPGGRVEIGNTSNENAITILIKDNGVGIPEDALEKLFRIDASYSTEGTAQETGTGLGLVLCKEFMNRNNGSIAVQSKVDEGSVFSITLPTSG